MSTSITNNLLNTIAQAKYRGEPMAEIRMTNHAYDRLLAENASALIAQTPSKPLFDGLPIIIDDRYVS